MAITRSDLLKELMPGLNRLFDLEYSKYAKELPVHNHEIEVNFDEQSARTSDSRPD